MNSKKLAFENYKRFCSLDGSDFIATEFALEVILNIIDKYEVKDILELGLGIGSISDTVLKYAKLTNKQLHYVGTEKNEFCRDALKTYVLDYNKIELHSELKDLKEGKFDLIIIDGQDESLRNVVSHCKEHTIIFVEGDRKGQTETMFDVFPKHKHVNIITLTKNRPYVHGECEVSNYMGGGQLIFTNPTFGMKIYWFKQKVATYIKRKIRAFKG